MGQTDSVHAQTTRRPVRHRLPPVLREASAAGLAGRGALPEFGGNGTITYGYGGTTTAAGETATTTVAGGTATTTTTPPENYGRQGYGQYAYGGAPE